MVQTGDHRGRMLRSELAGRGIAAGSKSRFVDVVKELTELVGLRQVDEEDRVGEMEAVG